MNQRILAISFFFGLVINLIAIFILISANLYNKIYAYIFYILATVFLILFIITYIKIGKKSVKKINKIIKSQNEFAKTGYIGLTSAKIIINSSLALVFNVIYSFFEIVSGFILRSPLNIIFGFYYLLLSLLRFFVVRALIKEAGDLKRMYIESIRIGILIFITDVVISVLFSLSIYIDIVSLYDKYLLFGKGIYLFLIICNAIRNLFIFKIEDQPLFFTSRVISFTAAFVALYSFEINLLELYNDDEAFRRILLLISGILITLAILIMSIYLIISGIKKIKKLKVSEE